VVVWDVEGRQVVRVIDTGAVPIPRGPTDYDADSVGKLREVPGPFELRQPLGAGFRVEGHEVSWQN
jgi:primary-amine oxidase